MNLAGSRKDALCENKKNDTPIASKSVHVRLLTLALSFIFAAILFTSPTAWSKRYYSQQDAVPYNSFAHPRNNERLNKANESEIDAASAAALVKQQHGGRVLKIQKIQTEQGNAFRVKILKSSGRVKNILVDAQSGNLISKPKR